METVGLHSTLGDEEDLNTANNTGNTTKNDIGNSCEFESPNNDHRNRNPYSMSMDSLVTINSNNFTMKEVEESFEIKYLSISEPKRSSNGSFIKYKIKSTLINNDEYNDEYTVFRRYNHFQWLYEQLAIHVPGSILPGLPEKHFPGFHEAGRFDEDFIITRMQGLEKFLARIITNLTFKNSLLLVKFLSLDELDFLTLVRQSKNSMDTFMSHVFRWFNKTYLKYQNSGKMESPEKNDNDLRLEKLKDDFNIQLTQSGRRHELASNYAICQSNLSACLMDISRDFSNLRHTFRSQSETSLLLAEVSSSLHKSSLHLQFVQGAHVLDFVRPMMELKQNNNSIRYSSNLLLEKENIISALLTRRKRCKKEDVALTDELNRISKREVLEWRIATMNFLSHYDLLQKEMKTIIQFTCSDLAMNEANYHAAELKNWVEVLETLQRITTVDAVLGEEIGCR